MTNREATAILEKLTSELEFAATNYGERSNLSTREYAEMLLDFIKTSQKSKAEA